MDFQHISSRSGHRVTQASLQHTSVLYWAAQTGPAPSRGLPPALTEGTRSPHPTALQAQLRMWSAPPKTTSLSLFKTAFFGLLEK